MLVEDISSVCLVRQIVFTLVLVCLTAACSTYGERPKLPSESASNFADAKPLFPGSAEAESKAAKEPPLSVRVAQAFVENDTLHVNVHLESKTSIPSKNVAVSVVGLREGEEVAQETKFVSDVLQRKNIAAEDVVSLRFALKSEDLSEYQVRATWGDDALRLARARLSERGSQLPNRVPVLPEGESRGDVIGLKVLKLAKRPVQCDRPPCDVLYTLTARLENRSQEDVSGVRLGLGLFWASRGAQPALPKKFDPLSQNEELVDISHVTIPKGRSKKIRVAVDRPVPRVSGGEFLPHLRIVSLGSISR